MPKLELFNVDGKNVGEVSAREEIFGVKPNNHVLHTTLCWYQASQRRGTHSAKTRGEVRGGGKKPWKQKGTGRARAGSIRSPLWRKGGVIFAPKPRDYSFALPKKVRQLALRVALSDKVREGKIKVLDEFRVSAAKTKQAAKMLEALNLSGKVLFVFGKENDQFYKAVRNISCVKIIPVGELNIFDLLNSEWVVAEKSAILKMEERFSYASRTNNS